MKEWTVIIKMNIKEQKEGFKKRIVFRKLRLIYVQKKLENK